MNVLSRDLSQLKAAFKSKLIWIALSFVVTAIICGVMYWKTPQRYTAHASFLVFENQADVYASDQISNALRLQKLSQSSLQKLVLDILLSDRLRTYVATQMQPYFQYDIDKLIADKAMPSDPISIQDYILGRLNMSENIIFFQRLPSSSTHLAFTNESPEIAKKTVQLHIDYLQIVNEELSLTARKQFVIELDPPAVDSQTKPELTSFFMIGFLVVCLMWSAYFSATLTLETLEEATL